MFLVFEWSDFGSPLYKQIFFKWNRVETNLYFVEQERTTSPGEAANKRHRLSLQLRRQQSLLALSTARTRKSHTVIPNTFGFGMVERVWFVVQTIQNPNFFILDRFIY